MEKIKAVKCKSVECKKSTMIKLPLKSTKSLGVDNRIPKVDLTPLSQENSHVEPNTSKDHVKMRYLALPLDDRMVEEQRKQSIMRLLSFMAKKKDRPSVFSRFRYQSISPYCAGLSSE